MSGVCFVHEAWLCDGDNAIEDAELVISLASFTQSPSDLQLEVLGELTLVPVEVWIEPGSSEVVTMDNN